MSDNTILPLDLDSRAEIQNAYHDCWEDIIEYNCCNVNVDDYGPTFKTGFYRHFQRLYFLSRLAFKEKRIADKELDGQLKKIEAYMKKLVEEKQPSKDDILKGHDYLYYLEPLLLGRNIITIAKGMKED
jgi:hypothetical protein